MIQVNTIVIKSLQRSISYSTK